MILFISHFLIFTFFLTVYDDWSIGMTIILILLIISWLRTRTFRKRGRYVAMAMTTFILANLSYFLYESKFPAEVVGWSMISTWQITSDLGGDKYIFETTQWSRYLMSKTGHTLGQFLRLVANIAPKTQISTWSDLRYQWFNFHKRLKMKGHLGALYETNSVSLSTWASLGRLADIRQNVRMAIVHRMTNPNGQYSSALAWALWMFIGDKSQFSSSQYQTLIDSGLVHLVAVSGGNVVMLVTFLTAILFRIPFYPRLILLLLAVISYGLLCGMDSSVFRAVIMGVLSLLALLVGRPNLTRRALGLTFVAMLIYNPYFLIYDVWFSLSFFAVIGLLLFDEFFSAKNSREDDHKPKVSKSLVYKIFSYPVKSYIKPSVWATLWVLPVLIFFMDKINLASIGANLFVLPVVPLLMFGSFLQLIVPPFLGVYILRCIEYLWDRIIWVSKFTSTHGVILSSDDLVVKYVLVGLFLVMLIGYHAGSTHPGGFSKKHR